jgi:prepilin peptidase CpaA
MIVYMAFVILFAYAALVDVLYLRIPNVLSILLVMLFALAVAVHPGGIDWLGHGFTGAAVFAVGALCFYLGYWGGGDVKLYAAGGLWMGPDLILPFLVWVSLLAGLVALVILGLRRIARLPMVARLPVFARGSNGGAALPPVLMSSAGVPLGLPLAAAAILLSGRISPAFWVF